jgi:hypothetical protein
MIFLNCNETRRVISILSLAIFFIFQACSPTRSDKTPAASVNPFDTTTAVTEQVLSEADKQQLGNSIGRKPIAIDMETLAQLVASADDRRYIYCFFNLKTPQSISTVKALKSISNKTDSSKIKFVLVHFSEPNRPEDLNVFIQEAQIIDDVLNLNVAQENDFFALLSNKIPTKLPKPIDLPLVICADAQNNTHLFYTKLGDEKEISAILQPFIF